MSGLLDAKTEIKKKTVAKIIRSAVCHVNYQWEGATAWVTEAEADRLADIILALLSKPEDVTK